MNGCGFISPVMCNKLCRNEIPFTFSIDVESGPLLCEKWLVSFKSISLLVTVKLHI